MSEHDIAEYSLNIQSSETSLRDLTEKTWIQTEIA